MSTDTPLAGAPSGTAPPAPVAGRPRPGLTLALVCTSIFMLLLDVTVVIVALADIQRDLGGGLAALQWVVDAYTLGLAGLLLTAATLGDRIGRRRIFAIGLLLFTLASAGCAAASTALQLDLVRGVQGIGGALVMGTSLPLLNDNFRSPAGRARAFGAFGATLAAATAVGPLVGGLLVAGPGWRWIFLLNLPIGALALVGTFGLVESRSATARRADWAGTVLFTTGLVALVLGLIRGNPDGWDAPRVLALLAVGAAALVAFVIREAVAAEPMLDLTLLRRRGYVGVLLGAFAMGASLIAATSYIALYLANGLGYGPLGVGLRFLPLTLAACVAALLAGELLTRFPLAWLIAGSLGLVAVGMFGLTRVDASSGYLPLAGWFIPAGLGFGASGAVLSAGALAGAVPAKAGMASGVMNTMRQVGLAAGVAGLGAVFQHVATGRAEQLAGAAGAPAPVASALARAIGDGAGIRAAGALSGPLHQVALVAGRSATAEALSRVAWIGGGLAAACAVLVLVLMPWGRAAR